jgi:hypothetical protein
MIAESPFIMPSVSTAFRLYLRCVIGVFILVFTGLLLFGYQGPIPYDFDAYGYWYLASHFNDTGHFSLLSFDSSLRGYLFPLILMVPRIVVAHGGMTPSLMSILLGSLQAALLFGWVLPALYNAVRPGSIFSPRRRMFFAALGLFFWGGYFNYTLSDFPAMLAFSGALLLLISSQLRPWNLLFAGILLGAALNFRPFFLVSIPPMLLLAGCPTHKTIGWGIRLRNILLLTIGMALPLLPQWQINRINFGRNTPLVLAQIAAKESSNLTLLQLGWGLKMQKVETAFGSAPGARNALVIYRDPRAEQLLREAGYQQTGIKDAIFKSFAEYLNVIIYHPITAGTIYLSRLFNGLDQHHNTPYIRQPIQQFTWLMPTVNYSMWFGVLLILWRCRTRLRAINLIQTISLLAWLLPCIIGCIVATENRFLLPAHLLLYAVLCFEWRAVLGRWREQNWLTIGTAFGAYAGFVTICFVFSWAIHRQQFLIFV